MNIKGKTIIELHDAKTGRLVKRTEDNNMLTKALYYFYDQGGMTNPTAFGNNNIKNNALQYLLGGILCLDTELDEDNEIVRVPAGVGMTANGAYNVVNTGNPPELGSWNENESGWQQDGSYKMVWDYTTSQGNGTIACVCLSSWFGAYKGIGNKSNTMKVNNVATIGGYNSINSKGVEGGAIVGYKDNVVYMLNSDFKNKTTISLKKYKFPFAGIDLRNVMTAELIEEKTLNLPSNLQGLTSGSGSANVSLDEVYIKGNKAYCLINRHFYYDNRVTGDIHIAEFDVTTEQITNSWVVDVSSETPQVNMTGISDKYVVAGLVWVEYRNQANSGDITDETGIYNNASSAEHIYLETIDTDLFEVVGRYNAGSAGYVYAQGSIDITTGLLLPGNGQGEIMPRTGGFMGNNNLLKVCSDTSAGTAYIARDPRYIASINNLEEPVTKTGDKTMKVTYVIRFS